MRTSTTHHRTSENHSKERQSGWPWDAALPKRSFRSWIRSMARLMVGLSFCRNFIVADRTKARWHNCSSSWRSPSQSQSQGGNFWWMNNSNKSELTEVGEGWKETGTRQWPCYTIPWTSPSKPCHPMDYVLSTRTGFYEYYFLFFNFQLPFIKRHICHLLRDKG